MITTYDLTIGTDGTRSGYDNTTVYSGDNLSKLKFKNVTILEISSGTNHLLLKLQGNLAQDFIIRMVIEGQYYDSVDATYTSSGGTTTWEWTPTGDILNSLQGFTRSIKIGDDAINHTFTAPYPDNFELMYEFGGAGIPEGTIELDVWLARTKLNGDFTTTPINITGLTYPVPAGSYLITFEYVDGYGETYTDTATLISTEAEEDKGHLPYYYKGQINSFLSQFMRIFNGIQVEYGVDRDNDGKNDRKVVNVVYGDMDRLIANVINKNNNRTAQSLPIISGYMTGLDLAPEIRKTRYHEDKTTLTKTSDSSHVSLQRLMSVPYRITTDLYILASNAQQGIQILEQIMLLFNPYLTIQKSDDMTDWSHLTRVDLQGITQETNFPAGTESRMVQYTLNFGFDVFLNYPDRVVEGVIKKAIANVLNNDITLEQITVTEVDVQ